jgi:hypothetical protein
MAVKGSQMQSDSSQEFQQLCATAARRAAICTGVAVALTALYFGVLYALVS